MRTVYNISSKKAKLKLNQEMQTFGKVLKKADFTGNNQLAGC